jgi:hypothetical protein
VSYRRRGLILPKAPDGRTYYIDTRGEAWVQTDRDVLSPLRPIVARRLRRFEADPTAIEPNRTTKPLESVTKPGYPYEG